MKNKFTNWKDVYSIEEIELQVIQSFPYENFFKGQKEAIVRVVDAFLNGQKKHVILEAPTGSGKTIIAWTVHKTLDKLIGNERLKTTVTTTTKGLQRQYVNDCGTMNLMGKTNYPCIHGHQNYNTIGCKHAVKQRKCKPYVECPYVKARINWTESAYWRSTNTSMFLEMCPILCMTEQNRADLVVFDECHKLIDSMCDHTEIEFNADLLAPVNAFSSGSNHHPIYSMAQYVAKKTRALLTENDKGKKISFESHNINLRVTRDDFGEAVFFNICVNYFLDENEIEELKYVECTLFDVIYVLNSEINKFLDFIDNKLKTTQHLDPSLRDICERVILRCQDYSDICEIITECGVTDFIVQELDEQVVKFKPLNSADVSEYSAFRKGDYFLHMSATICGTREYAKMLGIKTEDYHAITMDHPVDVERRQVNYMPVISMSGGFSSENARKMAGFIAELYEGHKGENGLVHTASYKLAEEIMSYLPPHVRTNAFIGRNRENTMNALGLSKGVLCLSPSMVEGYDLKHDLARWQVIAKIPFGYLGDPKIKYMAEKFKGSYNRDTVLKVVQSAGRVVRGTDDFGTTYILDKSLDKLILNAQDYFPKWFLDSLTEYD